MNLDRLLDAFDELEGAAGEPVLAELRDAWERGEWREDLPLIGDFYVALSEEADDDGEHAVARRLRAEAVGLPASDSQWVIGAHLADGYRGDRRGQLARLREAAEGLGAAQEARLLAAFAESIEPSDPETAQRLLEDALMPAIVARDAGDEDTYGTVIVPRALLRASRYLDRDEHDIAADAMLDATDDAERGGSTRDAPPRQAFVPMSELAEAAPRWPDRYPAGASGAAEFYAALEASYRALHAEYTQSFTLQPLSVAVADACEIDLAADPIEVPDEAWKQLAAEEPPLSWPPARNDACWCGSGKKYKRCCGAT